VNDSIGLKDESISRPISLRRIFHTSIQYNFDDESKVGDIDTKAIDSNSMQYFKPNESKNAIKVIGTPLTKVLEKIERIDETTSIDLFKGLLSLFNELDDIVFNYIKINYFEAFKASEHWLKFLQFMYITNIKVTKNDFTLCRVLGRGGFGLVTACKHSTTGKLYALKTMDKARVKMKKGEALCCNERKIQALIESKFLVCLKYAYTTDIDVNLIMDVMTGGDLSYHLGRKRKFCMKETIYYSSRIVQGLADMHEQNIVYRDLKPENVLMDEFGYTRLSDLGLACIVPKKGLVGSAGTRGYWAPEMLARDENNKRIKYGLAVDWFSLGCCIYEFICGVSPFKIKKAKSFKSVDAATLEMIPEFDDHFDSVSVDLLSKLLEKDQKKRLGANGALEIKMHPFFSQIDWGILHQKSPPLKPLAEINTGGQDDIGSFQDITDQNILLTEADHKSYDDWDFLSVKAYQEEIIHMLLHEEKSVSLFILNNISF
jgi:beta-adrenergic-receptor kinase